MDKLDKDWLTQDNTDFEYKKYILLAYLQTVNSYFDENKIYPYLGDLIEHFRILKDILENKDKLMPRELRSIDFSKMELIYTPIEDEVFKNLEKLIKFALNELQKIIKRGREIYDGIEENLLFEHVGILPTYFKEGYIIITTNTNHLYSYKLNDLVIYNIPYKIVVTRLIDQETSKLLSHENFKKEYILPLCDYIPPTFGVYCVEDLSIDHTLLPITKRKIIQYIRNVTT